MVPKNIRDVSRPINTVVIDSGSSGPLRYAVRARKEVLYVAGKNPQPRNGKVIGHIINDTFVPVLENTATYVPQSLSYGSSALIRLFTEDIYTDLLSCYPPQDALKLIVIAALKVIKPHISNNRINSLYNKTFISVFYPGANISKNTISKLLNDIGQDNEKRRNFYYKRILRVSKDHHIAIDGSLIQDTSIINDLSAFSRKSRLKGCKDISIIYAYDIEKMEPICAEVFPGNCIDSVAYKEFINKNNICKGILVTDKGFPPEKIYNEINTNDDLHYLTPIKRNSKKIIDNNMLDFDDVLTGVEKSIMCKKCKLSDNKYLYSFKDMDKSGREASKYISKSSINHNFDKKDFNKLNGTFGVIVFESDLNLPMETIYKCYEARWELELVFRHYKNDLGFDTTDVQSDFSVVGENFINFLSTIITCRILEKFKEKKLLNTMTYADIMEDLSSAWRLINAPINPKREDGKWDHTITSVLNLLEILDLSEPAEKIELHFTPQKRGRKAKKKEKEEISKVKRPRGRPPKPKSDEDSKPEEKRKVGRPRIHPLPDPNAPKRPRGRPPKQKSDEDSKPKEKRKVGRPRIHPLPDPNAPKRPRGRPPKPKSDEDLKQKEKRKVGRPRIHPLLDPNAPKRPRGRPPKNNIFQDSGGREGAAGV